MKQSIQFNDKGEITVVPDCCVPSCNNKAITILGGKWFCGKCLANWYNKKQENLVFDILRVNEK